MCNLLLGLFLTVSIEAQKLLNAIVDATPPVFAMNAIPSIQMVHPLPSHAGNTRHKSRPDVDRHQYRTQPQSPSPPQYPSTDYT
jgi:hypothetical protein